MEPGKRAVTRHDPDIVDENIDPRLIGDPFTIRGICHIRLHGAGMSPFIGHPGTGGFGRGQVSIHDQNISPFAGKQDGNGTDVSRRCASATDVSR